MAVALVVAPLLFEKPSTCAKKRCWFCEYVT